MKEKETMRKCEKQALIVGVILVIGVPLLFGALGLSMQGWPSNRPELSQQIDKYGSETKAYFIQLPNGSERMVWVTHKRGGGWNLVHEEEIRDEAGNVYTKTQAPATSEVDFSGIETRVEILSRECKELRESTQKLTDTMDPLLDAVYKILIHELSEGGVTPFEPGQEANPEILNKSVWGLGGGGN
ncbi:MAG: hypothetical protein ACYTEQ_01285 [Planctomycetota bacterium]|jgi:hypothetical protein